MAKIIMFGNQKGGVGKSLLTTMTATALGSAPFGLRVVVVDLDNQKTVWKCREIDRLSYPKDTVEPFEVYKMTLPELQKKIGDLDATADLIFLDAAGRLDSDPDPMKQEISRALLLTDLLFIPFVAGFGNLSATYDYLRFIQDVQAVRQLSKRQLSFCGFVNQFRTRSRANDFLLADIEQIKSKDPFHLMSNYLRDFALFKDADTITSLYDPLSNDTAKRNFSEWLGELIQIIKE